MPKIIRMDEGYLKFDPVWQKSAPFSVNEFSDLLAFRQKCYARKWIGAYPDGIGFGNISQRIALTDTFYISGSATGGSPVLKADQVAKVTRVDAAANRLWCTGPIVASSESMSHAIIYEQLPWVNGVIHTHDLEMWQRLLHHIPTTAADAPYGSPEMVESIAHLLKTTDLPEQRIFVMEGHREGVFVFGHDLEEAFGKLVDKA